MLSDTGSKQHDLLMNLIGRDSARALSSQEVALLSRQEGWDDVLTLALEHSVHGLMLSRLAALNTSLDGMEPIVARAGRNLRWLRSRAVLWDLERDRLMRILSLGGGRPVLLKGAALRLTVYADPVLRPLGDIDVLVPPDELETAVAVVREMGYQIPYSESAVDDLRKEHYHLRLVRDPFTIEVHWDLSRSRQPYQLDAASLLRRARGVEGEGRNGLRVPSPEDLALHLVAENLNHGTRLGRLVDLDRIFTGEPVFDWEYLFEASTTAGLAVALAVDLRLCEILLDTSIPGGYVPELGISRSRRRNIAFLRPGTWPFSRGPVSTPVSDLRRYWCVSERFRSRPLTLRHNEDPLRWIWLEGPRKAVKPSLARKAKRVGKRVGYQLWIYARALGSALFPRGRRALQFWPLTDPTTPRRR